MIKKYKYLITKTSLYPVCFIYFHRFYNILQINYNNLIVHYTHFLICLHWANPILSPPPPLQQNECHLSINSNISLLSGWYSGKAAHLFFNAKKKLKQAETEHSKGCEAGAESSVSELMKRRKNGKTNIIIQIIIFTIPKHQRDEISVNFVWFKFSMLSFRTTYDACISLHEHNP